MPRPWRVSLHGGHSSAYCDHARNTLDDMLQAAVNAGYSVFGVTEHAPRLGAEFLYREEVAMGWDVARLEQMFDSYAYELEHLVTKYRGELTVLRGFELEIVPGDRWPAVMQGYRDQYGFDFVVGSVHFVDGRMIDGPTDIFEDAMRAIGGLEALAERYYDDVADMVHRFRPEVVGHLDLIRKNGRHYGDVDTPPVRVACLRALDAIAANDGILDINTAGYRKGMPHPYPAPWILREAARRSIAVCFGDDSHSVQDVGAGLDEARVYLLENGYRHITALDRDGSRVVRRQIAL